MNRRDFFKTAAPLGFVPLLTGGLPIRSLAATSFMSFNPCNVTDRSMVVIYLNGGNDIFNTLVPLNQYSAYAGFRPTVQLPQSSLITLDGNLPSEKQLGLHPQLTGFKTMYDNGLMSFVQGVGYENPNRSHFKSLDNWLTGSGGFAVPNESTGMFGRFIKDRYPGYNGNPFIGEPDPLAVLFGDMNNTGFHTLEEHSYEVKLGSTDSNGFYTLLSALGGDPIQNFPMSEHGSKLLHVHNIEQSVNVYSQRMNTVFNAGNNSTGITYPNSKLGNQLKTIARLLKGGSRTKIFMATTGGFDTHAGQLPSHQNLMNDLSLSMKTFQDDLTSLGIADNTITVVFSEFGRKIIENGSAGVDHGTLSSVFLMGNAIEGGVIGNNMDLNNQQDDAPHPNQTQYDYREIFGTIFQDWFGANNVSLDNTLRSNTFYANRPNLFNLSNIVPSSCYFTPVAPQVCACVQVKVALEGFYDPMLNTMRTDLLNNSLLPTNQPYNIAPFHYTGTEMVSTFPTDTVDWLLVELREASDLNIVVAQKAVLLRADGYVMETDGTPGITFPNITDGSYHVVVRHRNHLPVASADPVLIDAPNYLYDFTFSQEKSYGQEQAVQVGTAWTMIAGDIDNNHIINNLDFNSWKTNNGSTALYSPNDLNGDGNIDTLDKALWDLNRSKIGELR